MIISDPDPDPTCEVFREPDPDQDPDRKKLCRYLGPTCWGLVLLYEVRRLLLQFLIFRHSFDRIDSGPEIT